MLAIKPLRTRKDSRSKKAASERPLFSPRLRIPLIQIVIALVGSPFGWFSSVAAKEIQFNTDVLDVQERSQIDLRQFSQAGYIMPGTYTLSLQINNSTLSEQPVRFLAPDNDPDGSEPCLTSTMVEQLGLTDAAMRQLRWWHNNACLDPASLPGMGLQGDLGNGILHVILPTAFVEYTADNWDPPSRWDDGVTGLLFDYNLNAQVIQQRRPTNSDRQSITGDGVVGINVGPWRLRSDWQAQYNRRKGADGVHSQQDIEWYRYYMYRAIRSMRAKLTLGEDYLNSGMFDSFRYTGLSLISDDNMLSPNLRGYAPEVTGVAKTNAKVTITQQGRLIYDTTVAAGPFRIQDLNNAVTGKLDVKVEEQDGSVQTFEVDTANVPYLTRPGLVRYKFAAGKPSDYDHHVQSPEFAVGEFSWGVSNGWSVYGGALLAGKYNALSAGVGRDLLAFGALSFDVTQSRAALSDNETKQGRSYRLSYSKRFDATDSQVTFAGYRFSEREFLSLSQYLDLRQQQRYLRGSGKELYTLSVNQQLHALNMTAYLSYSHQTYWDRPTNDAYNLSVAKSFDAWQLKNLSLSLSVFRSKYDGENDDGAYLSLSIPLGEHGSVSYDTQKMRGSQRNTVSYSDQLDTRNNYRLSVSHDKEAGSSGSGYLKHEGSLAEVNVTASTEGSHSRSAGLSVRGGITATSHGVALHRISQAGGLRMMVDTNGVAGIPVRGIGGANTRTNLFGKAVISDISSYYRSSINVDLDALNDDVEATRSVVQGSLTEGAIGYRKFGILAGQKAMAVIRMADGSSPPFGAVVLNANHVQTGLVSEEGNVWLSGINPNQTMQVSWNGKVQCELTFPPILPDGNVLLPCTPTATPK